MLSFFHIHANLTGAFGFLAGGYYNLATAIVSGSTASLSSWEPLQLCRPDQPSPAVGPTAQARDTGRLGEEERADSNLRKSDYLEKERMVL
jgi:hypothetical protein